MGVNIDKKNIEEIYDNLEDKQMMTVEMKCMECGQVVETTPYTEIFSNEKCSRCLYEGYNKDIDVKR